MNTVHYDCVRIQLSALTVVFSVALPQHSAIYTQSLEGSVAALCGGELMSAVLTTSLISHAAGNKNGISINQERSACGGVGGGSCIEVCVCRLAQAVCHRSL